MKHQKRAALVILGKILQAANSTFWGKVRKIIPRKTTKIPNSGEKQLNPEGRQHEQFTEGTIGSTNTNQITQNGPDELQGAGLGLNNNHVRQISSYNNNNNNHHHNSSSRRNTTTTTTTTTTNTTQAPPTATAGSSSDPSNKSNKRSISLQKTARCLGGGVGEFIGQTRPEVVLEELHAHECVAPSGPTEDT